MIAEFLLLSATRHQIKIRRAQLEKDIDDLSEMDWVYRVALGAKEKFPGLVQGPYESGGVELFPHDATIRCLVINFSDAKPILDYLVAAGFVLSDGHEDGFGRRQFNLRHPKGRIYLNCFPDKAGGSECRSVVTGYNTYPIYEYTCDPEFVSEGADAEKSL